MRYDVKYFRSRYNPAFFSYLSRYFLLYVKPNTKVLEIGCGKADFVKWFEERFFRLNGLILSDIVKYDDSFDHPFFVYSIEEEPNENLVGYFDVVIAIDVIEHLSNQDKSFRNIKLLLKNDGIFIFTTPNVHSFKRLLLGNRWCGYFDTTHFILYDSRILHRVLRNYFSKISIHYFTQISSFIFEHKICKEIADNLLVICKK